MVESKGSDVDNADIILNTHRDSIVVENVVEILENGVNDELYQVEREPEPVENLEFETVVENEMTNVVEESVENVVEIETVAEKEVINEEAPVVVDEVILESVENARW